MEENRTFPSKKFEPSTTETVEMTEIDTLSQDVALCFTDIGDFENPREEKQIRTCYGDLYVIINALRDYANLLESVIQEWGLSGFHAAKYEYHAARCQKIAEKYAAGIGYDYDKAVERCKKRREKPEPDDGAGMDALEAAVQKGNRKKPQKP